MISLSYHIFQKCHNCLRFTWFFWHLRGPWIIKQFLPGMSSPGCLFSISSSTTWVGGKNRVCSHTLLTTGLLNPVRLIITISRCITMSKRITSYCAALKPPSWVVFFDKYRGFIFSRCMERRVGASVLKMAERSGVRVEAIEDRVTQMTTLPE